jgi:hypothetical protein
MITFGCFENKTSSRVLELLEFMNEIERTASEKNITIVEFRKDEGACKSVGDLNREKLTDRADSVDFKVG